MKTWSSVFFVGTLFCAASLALPGEAQDTQKPEGESQPEVIVEMRYRKTPAGEVTTDVSVEGVDCNDKEKLACALKSKAEKAGFDEENQSKLRVIIRADGRILYSSVQRVMVICMKVRIGKIAFGDEPPPKEKTPAAEKEDESAK